MRRPIVSFGETLFDLFPSGPRLGGAPLNFAWHLWALGREVTLMSRVGRDELGRRILDLLARGPGAAAVQEDPDHPTGTVRVELDVSGVPRFEIAAEASWDHITWDASLEAALAARPALVYFGTLGQRHPTARHTLATLLDRLTGVPRIYDMNLRPPYDATEIVAASLTACDLVKLNQEEAAACRERFGLNGTDDDLAETLLERFDLQGVCITHGEAGSRIVTRRGSARIQGIPVTDVADTVGAGDGYTAVLALGWLAGWEPDLLLERATRFAAALCTIPGAVPEEASFYDPFRSWFEETDHGR